MPLTASSSSSKEVTILASEKNVVLKATLTLPPKARSMVIFAHGSSSSRLSPRNQYVSRRLNQEGLATLLLDLLTKEEERVDESTHLLRFDVDLLSERLLTATRWAWQQPETKALKVGYFGSSTGAAAALIAAARSDTIAAVVSRGGRPDLAQTYLPILKASTLLIVGGQDHQVIDLNRQALAQLNCHKELAILPGATHLFEEAGALEQISRLASAWFLKYC